jgi:hypothetical protein
MIGMWNKCIYYVSCLLLQGEEEEEVAEAGVTSAGAEEEVEVVAVVADLPNPWWEQERR